MGGPAVVSLLILCALCAYAVLNHLSLALRKPIDRLHLLLSGICFVLIGFALSQAATYQAHSISDYVTALKCNLTCLLVFFMLFPWFIAEFTGFRPRKWLLISTLAFALMTPANLVLPFSLQFTVITKLASLRLPWGEEITLPVGQHGPLFQITAAAILFNLGFALWTLAVKWRRDRTAVSLTMLIAMVIWLGTAVEGVLVRASALAFIHAGPYGCLLMVIIVSLALSRDTIQHMALLDFALNNVREAAFLSDPKGCLRYVNAESCRALGYSREELLGLSVTAINPDFLLERVLSFWDELKGKGSIIFRSHYKSKDGRLLPVEISANYFTYAGRSYNLALARDISLRLEAEEKLRLAAEEWQTTFNSTRDLFFLIDKDYKITKANQAVSAFLQLPEGKIIGKYCYELMHGTTYPLPDCPLSKLQRSVKHEDAELYLEAQNIWVQVTVDPVLDEKGKLLGAVHIVRNITERKRLEDQLRQAQKMEAIGTLAGGVAHDFNNMLSIIIGYTDLALDQVDPSFELFTNLKEVRQAAGRSADLTRQLLAFARKQTISPRVLDVNETVAGMLQMLRRLIGEALEIVWRPGDGIWPLRMDPSQMDQILANLCVNARDAIEGSGTITIETHNASIDKHECAAYPEVSPGQYVTLAVHDNGCGMDKETLSKIFEPFYTTKQYGKGTGLGLATMYGIVKQNNGFINVCSEPGVGSVFKIFLPRHTAGTGPIPKENSTVPAAQGPETLLLVEDEPPLLAMGKLMLEKLGYRVLAAATPGDAILAAKAHTGRIQLLITDVVMPEMNGRELAKNLNSLCPGLRYLFMSGYTGNVIAQHGVLDEGVNFIQKPFSLQTLAAKVREAMDGGW